MRVHLILNWSPTATRERSQDMSGPAEPGGGGGKGGSCPPTFLADNVNLFNSLIIADAYTSTSISSGARRQPDFCSFVLVQCLTLVSYSDLIVCLTKETPKYFCFCFFDSQPIGF